VNSHSQGTVVAFDTLRTLSCEALDLICGWFTMGSPLRKYAEVLDWGRDTGGISGIPWWINVWDHLDPVADPLRPDDSWRRGGSDTASAPPGLFVDVDPESGTGKPSGVADCKVDNVHHVTAPGLRAHDYWGNVDEVVPEIAKRLRSAADSSASATGRGAADTVSSASDG
jgi:hypothetical protein